MKLVHCHNHRQCLWNCAQGRALPQYFKAAQGTPCFQFLKMLSYSFYSETKDIPGNTSFCLVENPKRHRPGLEPGWDVICLPLSTGWPTKTGAEASIRFRGCGASTSFLAICPCPKSLAPPYPFFLSPSFIHSCLFFVLLLLTELFPKHWKFCMSNMKTDVHNLSKPLSFLLPAFHGNRLPPSDPVHERCFAPLCRHQQVLASSWKTSSRHFWASVAFSCLSGSAFGMSREALRAGRCCSRICLFCISGLHVDAWICKCFVRMCL